MLFGLDENGQDDFKWYNAGQDITEFELSITKAMELTHSYL